MNEQQKTRIANYLGIAQKAGRIAAGDASAKEALLKKRGFLLVLAEDASVQVKKELLALAGEMPVLTWPDKVSLGYLLGKSRRGAVVVLDQGFANAILKVLAVQTD